MVKRKSAPREEDDFFDDSDIESQSGGDQNNDGEVIKETPAQRRRRLAYDYIEKVKKEVEGNDLDNDAVLNRLKTDELLSAGKLTKQMADEVDVQAVEGGKNTMYIKPRKGIPYLNPTTCVVFVPGNSLLNENAYLFSSSKSGSIMKWNFYTGEFISKYDIPNSTRMVHVLCLSASHDGKFLAVGTSDNCIHIWSIPEDRFVETLKRHKDSVTGLAFGKNNALYSCSKDQRVIVWDMDPISYVETLFGHQDCISQIYCLMDDRCATSGTRDRTVRYWKIPEQTQLILREYTLGPSRNKRAADQGEHAPNIGSIEAIACIDSDTLVSGTDIGSISLWTIRKKKPIFSIPFAHGETNENNTNNMGIISLASYCYSDLFASGSNVGSIKLWKISRDKKTFSQLASIAMSGFINSLSFCDSADKFKHKKIYLIAGVGKEHRLGKWAKINSQTRNGICVVPLTSA